MANIRIVTDSTADLPERLIHQYGITVVPLKVHFGDEMYLDGINLSSGEFFQKLKASNVVSSTSQPTPLEFARVYDNLVKNGDSVLSIHISSEMSGTVHSAELARDMHKDSIIRVVDSRFVSMALGLIVLEAAERAQKGAGLAEITERISYIQKHMQVFFYVDTLKYLELGGRIGKATALLGTLLNVKPILTIKDGFVGPFEKVRGKHKALNRVKQLVEQGTSGKMVKGALVHGANPEDMEYMYEFLVNKPNCTDLIQSELGAVVGTHAGPGMLGVIYYPV